MAEIPVFNPKATCPKCGDKVVRTHYQVVKAATPLDSACYLNARYESPCPDGEHLHRRCTNCGFAWPEACLPMSPEVAAMLGETDDA